MNDPGARVGTRGTLVLEFSKERWARLHVRGLTFPNEPRATRV